MTLYCPQSTRVMQNASSCYVEFHFFPSFLSFCSEDLRRFLPITVLVSKVSLKGARGGWRLKISTERKAIHLRRNIFIQCKCTRNAGKCIFNERFKTIRCWETSCKLPEFFSCRLLRPAVRRPHAEKHTSPLVWYDLLRHITHHEKTWIDFPSILRFSGDLMKPVASVSLPSYRWDKPTPAYWLLNMTKDTAFPTQQGVNE